MTYKTLEVIFDVLADTLAAVKAEPLRQRLPKVNARAVVDNFADWKKEVEPYTLSKKRLS